MGQDEKIFSAYPGGILGSCLGHAWVMLAKSSISICQKRDS